MRFKRVTSEASIQPHHLEKLNISLLSGDEVQITPAVARSQYSALKPSVSNSDTKAK